ncbi:hypothetical protein KIPB_006913, partial [Kipferlia bialata]
QQLKSTSESRAIAISENQNLLSRFEREKEYWQAEMRELRHSLSHTQKVRSIITSAMSTSPSAGKNGDGGDGERGKGGPGGEKSTMYDGVTGTQLSVGQVLQNSIANAADVNTGLLNFVNQLTEELEALQKKTTLYRSTIDRLRSQAAGDVSSGRRFSRSLEEKLQKNQASLIVYKRDNDGLKESLKTIGREILHVVELLGEGRNVPEGVPAALLDTDTATSAHISTLLVGAISSGVDPTPFHVAFPAPSRTGRLSAFSMSRHVEDEDSVSQQFHRTDSGSHHDRERERDRDRETPPGQSMSVTDPGPARLSRAAHTKRPPKSGSDIAQLPPLSAADIVSAAKAAGDSVLDLGGGAPSAVNALLHKHLQSAVSASRASAQVAARESYSREGVFTLPPDPEASEEDETTPEDQLVENAQVMLNTPIMASVKRRIVTRSSGTVVDVNTVRQEVGRYMQDAT